MKRIVLSAMLALACAPAMAQFQFLIPLKIGERIAKGESPERALSETAKEAGQVVQQPVEVVQQIHETSESIQRRLINDNLGPGWADAYAQLRGNQRVQAELALMGGRVAASCLRGSICSPEFAVAGPVAALLRDAYKHYAPRAEPLPEELIELLSPVFSEELLRTVRIAIGNVPNATLPGYLNSGYRLAGAGHAVAIADLIIFDRLPDSSDWNDLRWLMHELAHVEQYFQMAGNVEDAIDRFALRYIRSYRQVEDEAEQVAQTRIPIVWEAPD